MRDRDFDVQMSWSGMGRSGTGVITTADAMQELSAPRSMGGTGTSPEELLVSAVALSYTVTLAGMLNRAQLPLERLVVSVRGTVGGTAGERFERIVVNATILEGDAARRDEYEQTAQSAHQRSFLGTALSADTACEVDPVSILPIEAAPHLSTTRTGRPIPASVGSALAERAA